MSDPSPEPQGRRGNRPVSGALYVQLLHVPDCPNVEGALRRLRDCLADLGLDAEVEDLEGDYPSPTILVNGRDMMGTAIHHGASCRIDVPTRERVVSALTRR